MTVRKPFSQKLYEQNDSRGKIAGAQFFESKGWEVEDVKHEMFKAGDLLVRDANGKEFYVEIEIAGGARWYGEGKKKFRFDTIHIPTRKELADLYLTFNPFLDSVVIMKEADVLASPKVKVNTTNSSSNQQTKNELFHDVDVKNSLRKEKHSNGNWYKQN